MYTQFPQSWPSPKFFQSKGFILFYLFKYVGLKHQFIHYFNCSLSIFGFMYEFRTIWHTLDHKTIQIWWSAHLEYKHAKLWSSCCWYFAYYYLMFLSPQEYIRYYFWTSEIVQICLNVSFCVKEELQIYSYVTLMINMFSMYCHPWAAMLCVWPQLFNIT